jgi:5-methyltetrahydrofolate--homocysteine methyltransferase
MDDLADKLNDRLILDGAMGTQLFAAGLGGDCPEVWNVQKPDAVTAIHRAYIDAGTQVVLTNTFGATEWKLAKSGHADDQERLCRAATENALRAAEDRAWVLGDVGPTGELPEPFGLHSLDDFEDEFMGQIVALVAAGVHGILVESMMSSAEAEAAVRAAKRCCGLPVIGSMTYAAGKQGYRTMMGETVAECTEKLLAAGADAVGANCGLGAGQMVDVVREIRAVTDGPVWAKPNAGQAKLVDGQTVFDEPSETWAAKVPEILAAGANLVGGCCGTTPEHIARACELLGSG